MEVMSSPPRQQATANPAAITLLLNILRVAFGGFWILVCGIPVAVVIYFTYAVGWLLEAGGRAGTLDRVVEWNAAFMGRVARHIWSKWILAVVGVTVRTHEQVPIDWRQTHVICANHASIFDILALVRVIPGPFRFVAKRELLRWPVFGWVLPPSGQILIDRRDRSDAVRRLERGAARKVRGQVIFFVEGTRSRTGELLPFKKGAFHFAVDHQLPILPTAICGSFGVLGRTSWWWLRPGRDIEIRYGAPIQPPAAASPEEKTAAATSLLDITRQAIEREIQTTT